MPRLSDFQQRFDDIKSGRIYGQRSADARVTEHTRIFLLNQLLVSMEKAYEAVPMYDDKMQKKDPAAYDLYMMIRESRYAEEVMR